MLDIPTARSLLRQTRPRRHADGYPESVRVQVTELARGRIAQGHTLTAVANELAVHRGTRKHWLARQPAEAARGFVAVEVAPARRRVVDPTPPGAFLAP